MNEIQEEDIIRAFHALQAASLALARNEQLIDAETLESFDQPGIVRIPAAPALSSGPQHRSVAALRSKGTPPSIDLASVDPTSASLGVLTSDNCPASLKPLLDRWSSLVPAIKAYNQENVHELCRALVDLPPLNSPITEEMTALATSLRALALEIGQRRSFQELFSGDLQAALDYESNRTGGPSRKATYKPPPGYSANEQRAQSAAPQQSSSLGSPAALAVLQAVRETLYAALAEALSTSPDLLAILSSEDDPRRPKAYFSAVALAVLFVALNQVDPDKGTVRVVSLGSGSPTVVSEANCPPHLQGVVEALCGIAYAARSLRDADDAAAVERAVTGDDSDIPTHIDRLRQRLEMGDAEESELSNAVNAMAIRVSRMPQFLEKQSEVFELLCGLRAANPTTDRRSW